MNRAHPLSRVFRRGLFWRGLFLAALAAVGYGTLSPLQAALKVPGNDKLQHLLAFAGLAVLLALSSFRRPPLWLSAVGLAAYGGAIELLQLGIPGRDGAWLDVAADGIGVGLGLLATAVFARAFQGGGRGRSR